MSNLEDVSTDDLAAFLMKEFQRLISGDATPIAARELAMAIGALLELSKLNRAEKLYKSLRD